MVIAALKVLNIVNVTSLNIPKPCHANVVYNHMSAIVMRRFLLNIIFIGLLPFGAIAQKKVALPHGMVYGTKPGTVGMMPASKLEDFMGKRARTSTVIFGKVLEVTKAKGGWFNMDAGSGRIIQAHFKNYGITLPVQLKGREVIIEGIASKQFIADDQQHFAGDTVVGKKQQKVNADPKKRLIFEVTGLMINK